MKLHIKKRNNSTHANNTDVQIMDAEEEVMKEFYETLQENIERERKNYTVKKGDREGIVEKAMR